LKMIKFGCMMLFVCLYTYIYRYTYIYIYTYISNHICVLVQVQLSIGCHRMSVVDALDLRASGAPSPFSTLIACSALGMP
jgi:hypothetical protein